MGFLGVAGLTTPAPGYCADPSGWQSPQFDQVALFLSLTPGGVHSGRSLRPRLPPPSRPVAGRISVRPATGTSRGRRRIRLTE